MPYTEHNNLCSVRYSLAQSLLSFHCPMSIAVRCTLVYRSWSTTWLSRPDKFWEGKYYCPETGSRRQGWLSACPPVWVCLHRSASAWILPVFLLLICSFPKCGNDWTCNCRKKPSLIGVGVLRPKTASCSETGNSQNTMTADVAGSVHCIII